MYNKITNINTKKDAKNLRKCSHLYVYENVICKNNEYSINKFFL